MQQTIFKKSNLRKHIKNVHDKCKFICEISGKNFTRKDNMLRHRKSLHSENIELCVKTNLVEKKTCWRKKMPVVNIRIVMNSFFPLEL